MGSLKQSTFPAVLKQYLPDYEPSLAAVVSGPKRSAGSPREAGCRCLTDSEHKSRVTASSSGDQRAAHKSSKSLQPLVRETTTLQLKRQDIKRYKQNYENWQSAKAELKEESGRQLRARILVQQELIRQQTELSALRQRELFLAVSTRREAEKELKQAQCEALQQVCRQSLDDDKQKAVDERRSHGETSKHGGSKDSLQSGGSSVPRPKPGGGGPTLRATLRRQAHPTPSRHPSHHALTHEMLPSQPSMVAEEGEEEEGEVEAGRQQQQQQQVVEEAGDEQVESGGNEPLPWHWEQLYKLYGKQADYFLKPRPEEKERKKMVTILNPNKLRVRGRAGAGSLWTSLRHESEAKLVQQDMTISPELKAAYSSFVRQCLARRKKPVKRNFYAEEDSSAKVTTMDDVWREQVPEMNRLLDNSRILSAHDYKHMVEVMFRASTMNQDRTGVLMHNNPPPNLNNWAGNESCGRYMPSWIPDDDDEEEEPEYRKWVNVKAKSSREGPKSARPASSTRSEIGQGDARNLPAKMTSVSMDATSHHGGEGDADSQWEFLRKMKPKSRKPKTPKYMFLTEEAATCAGQFSKQRKELLESRHIPQAFNEKTGGAGLKPQSALAMVGDNSTRRGSDFSESARSVGRTQSQLSIAKQYTSNWQPLSLDALVEYKQAVRVMGQGEFQHGTVPRWSVDMVEKAH